MHSETGRPDNGTRTIPLFVKLLATLISAVFVGLGALSIITEYHVGRSRYSGLVVREGEDAILMGVVQILIGMFPLAFWMPGKRSAAWFAGTCILTGVTVIFLSQIFLKP